MRRRLVLCGLYALLGIGFAAFAFDQWVWPAFQTKILSTHPGYFVLVDISRDTKRARLFAAQKLLSDVADHAQAQQGLLATMSFQDHARAKANWQNVSFVPPSVDKRNQPGIDYYTATSRADFDNQTQSLFLHPTPLDGTDIIGALVSTWQTEFDTLTEATTRILIIDSNMANATKQLDLKKRVYSLTDDKTKLAELSQAGELADLHGACVYIVGYGVIPSEPVKSPILDSIYRFWSNYFAQAGVSKKRLHWVTQLEWPLECPSSQ